ncbi:MAG: pullulanase-type alpha-1,6-glucosidase [Oscillochloris sp.]|nr:pullulanase-type alpha-1,6-glucosidase [Oscillochloris sp.]
MNGRTLWRPMQLVCVVALLAGLIGVPVVAPTPVSADHTAAPTRVTVPGNFGSEIGCTAGDGDWQPGCDTDPGVTPVSPDPLQANDLSDQGNGVWAGTISIPATNAPYEYKVAINGNWAENYPANNVGLAIGADTAVRFYYDHKTHFVTDNFNRTIYTLPGNFNSELGCSGDWQPNCLRSLMSDVDGDGIYTFTTDQIPAGDYEFKVASDEDWNNPNYGIGGGGDNLPFSLPIGGVEVTFSFNSATNVPTVEVGVPDTFYTLPGNFNNEIGCSGDWQPDCLETLMSDVDGDGVYTFVTDAIPAGSYEFKVALNGTWDTSYGLNGGGDNVPFLVPVSGLAVTFSFDSATNIPAVAVALPSPPPAEDAALLRDPVSDPANQDEVFYFVMPDRFNNANAANDTGGIAGDVLDHGYLPSNKAYYHGGDLAGLQARISYLKSLGVTAIWMTPMFKNRAVQCDPLQPVAIENCSSAYHGYWPVDFTQIDPHFGTNAEMKAFVQTAQAQGMRVFFDIITNHTADVIDYESRNYTYVPRSDAPYRDAGGNIFDDRDFIFAEAFPAMNRYSFPKRPVFRTPEDATVKVPAWLNDITMYHNRGNAAFDGSEGDIYGDFVGLDGLFTERPAVVEGMIDIHEVWIDEFGIDGFRVDTVKHVNMEFWQQFVPAIRQYAAAKGKPDFFVFAEVFDGNPAFLSTFTREGEFPATLDFDFNYSAGDFAVGSAGPGRLSGLFAGDDYYTTPVDNAYNQPTFLGNHDVGRIGNRMQAKQDPDDLRRVQRMLLGYGLMFTARGVPIIYYGDEQGFTGDGGDQLARQNMFPSQVDVYNDDDLIGTDATTAADNFDQSHPIYVGMAELAALRKAHPALQIGAQIERLAESGSSGVYAFSRIDRDQKVEYIVALNNDLSDRSVDIQTFGSDGTQFSAIYGASGTVGANAQGRINVTVPALGMVVYRQTGAAVPVVSNESQPLGPIITITAPADGTTLLSNGLIEVAANVVGNSFAEVSFAVSVNGGAYAHIGTDTNAPYRVFYDAGDLAGGTQLSFKAVVTDILGPTGNFNSATTTVALGIPDVCTVSYEFAIVHYYREDGNYDDWGLHLWGDAIADEEATTWDAPKPFLGRTEYGAFAFVRLKDPSKPVNFIVHQPGGDSVPDTRDPGGDRSFIPADQPQIFLKGGDATIYANQAAAQGYITVHYNRPDGNYSNAVVYAFGDGLSAEELTNHPTSDYPGNRGFNGSDDFGAYVRIGVGDPTKQIGFIIINDGAKDPGDGDRLLIPADQPSAWVNSGDLTTYGSRSAAEGVVTLRYHRPAGDYGDYASDNFNDFWGLHTWAGTANPNPAWQQPFKPVGPPDSFGVTFQVELADEANLWAYILHRGDEKDKSTDQFLNIGETGNEIWIYQSMPGDYPYLLPVQPGCSLGQGNVTAKQRAHWVSQDTFAWPIVASPQVAYRLHYAPNGGLTFANGAVGGPDAQSFPLTLEGTALSQDLAARFPHLADLTMLKLDLPEDTIKQILKGQLWVSASTADTGIVEVTGVQIPGVLDDLYAAPAKHMPLGPIFPANWNPYSTSQQVKLRLWAPTAQEVAVRIYDDAYTASYERFWLTPDPYPGTWEIDLPNSMVGKFYLFEVQVFVPSTGQVETNIVGDPYSVSLSMNSTRSQLINLSARELKPAGWDNLRKPKLDGFEDVVLYELHIRDFSITDESVPENLRGTYMAFTRYNSDAMRHLRDLARDGLSHVHLLPAFDIASINEDASERSEILDRFDDLRAMAPDGEEQQAIADSVRDLDGFNWGYDPYYYNVPEGSYSTEPNGTPRIRQFREMVRGLNRIGLRVVMDVVYNHTAQAGQSEKSVLDKVVPGYYHRLNADGQIEQSTCCQNTATEHLMMRKLMVDSLVLWARAYKVDGFRFDLMGHHMKEDMLEVKSALNQLTLAKDGVDGSKIFIYGEGWNFGEVADGRQGINATQRNMAGTGIATFSDRLRDAVRGGGPFDSGEGAKRQGFINGLFYDPNDLDQGDQRAALLHATDLIKVGLAGNLAHYRLINAQGNMVNGEDVDYNGSPGGYVEDPQEVITYIEAHDNETLFDAIQLKAPTSADLAARVRMQNMGISIVLLGQGVPFIQAGQEFLRSKSGDRNSYNSGDWFNRVDWTLNENNWGSGLPIQADNNNNWAVLRPVLGDPTLKPGNAEMVDAYEHFSEMLRIRKSSQLFRLGTADRINKQVGFLNNGPDQTPGLIVMHIRDNGSKDLDPRREHIVVLFNASDQEVTFTVAELAGLRLNLHQVQRNSHDDLIAGASFDRATGTFTVPARTTVVFED